VAAHVEGSDVRDDPFAPISAYAIALVEEQGDQTPISWLHRSQRFAEKLASPTRRWQTHRRGGPHQGCWRPVSGRSASALLRPRAQSNRGIFAMNELPDLSERIRWDCSTCSKSETCRFEGTWCASNWTSWWWRPPTRDYTNRGRLITPLKDRFVLRFARTTLRNFDRDRDRPQEARLPVTTKTDHRAVVH